MADGSTRIHCKRATEAADTGYAPRQPTAPKSPTSRSVGAAHMHLLMVVRSLAAKGAAYAGAATSIAAFDRAFQHLLAARPQLCTASEVQRVL